MLATMQPVPANGVQRQAGPGKLVPASMAALPSPFCEYLLARGGLHLWFAEFLKWRSDLLHGRTLAALQSIPAPGWSLPREQAVAIIQADLGESAAEAAATLSTEAFWSGGAGCAFRARFEGREVVIQFSRSPFAPAEFAALERSLAAFRDQALESPPGAIHLLQFREWTRTGLSTGAGRRLLEAVSAYRGETVTLFPEPVARLCSDRLLGYTWLDGEPLLGQAALSGRPELLQKWLETMLEQVCLFSVVDADARLDNLVLTPAGRIGLRVPPGFWRSHRCMCGAC